MSVQQADLDRPCHDHAPFHFQTLASEYFFDKVQHWLYVWNVQFMVHKSSAQEKIQKQTYPWWRWQQKQKANISLEHTTATSLY